MAFIIQLCGTVGSGMLKMHSMDTHLGRNLRFGSFFIGCTMISWWREAVLWPWKLHFSKGDLV